MKRTEVKGVAEKDIRALLAEESADVESRRPLRTKLHRSRRPVEPSQVYSIRLPVDRLEQLRSLAERFGMTPSALMRKWVTDRLRSDAVHEPAGTASREAGKPEGSWGSFESAVRAAVYKATAELRQAEDRGSGTGSPLRWTAERPPSIQVVGRDDEWSVEVSEYRQFGTYSSLAEAVDAAHGMSRTASIIVVPEESVAAQTDIEFSTPLLGHPTAKATRSRRRTP
jgi:hypothetical protein